jgi:V/A-type H+-transporting ATPase subunit E
MNTTLQELADKIYAEGVEKGKEEAAAIVAQAQQKAQQIVADAQAQAAAVLAQSEQKAKELDKNTRAELRLFAQQSVNALKTEVTNLLTGRLATDSVKAATADGKFMQKIIADLAAQMAKTGDVTIETNDAKALNDYFMKNAKGLLDAGVEINEVKGIKTHFTISAKNGGYKLAFGDEEFIEYFKQYLRPQLIEMLF